MLDPSGPIWELWNSGGPFVGPEAKPHGRVTVEKDWSLRTSTGAVGAIPASKLPVRWFQRADSSEVETEIPNVKMIHIVDSVETDVSQLDLVIYNQKMSPANAAELGNPGYFSYTRGSSAAAGARWGHAPNEWANVLVPNALLRTYEGYGGYDPSTGLPLSIDDCLASGNLVKTGTWLVDSVDVSTNGLITIKARDMRKLLMDEEIYPPYVRSMGQGGVYPLHYARFYHRTTHTPKIAYGAAAGGVRLAVGIESDALSDGYWIAGDDGGVFTYGNNQFYGSLGNEFDHEVIGIAILPSQAGYWIGTDEGVVFRFGAANDHGGHAPAPGQSMVAIETAPPIDGYWMCDSGGNIYAFGAAGYFGGSPVLSHPVVAMAVMPNGLGYWFLDDRGEVFAYGAANYFGNATYAGSPFTAMASTPSGAGYYLVDKVGHIYAFGDAAYRGGTDHIVLDDPISDIAVAPNGAGYWLVAEDGGVFTFSDTLQFYGSLPGVSDGDFQSDGNYFDYSDIITDLLLWAGFWLYDPTGVTQSPLATIETTGAYAENDLPDSLFDKVKVMDVITKIREIVGYIMFRRPDGGVHFESPNWWGPGNTLPTGVHTDTIPSIDELIQLNDYAISHDDDAARSEITISSDEPTIDLSSTVTTTVTPPSADVLKGIPKPALWVNEAFLTSGQQAQMANLIAIQIWFAQRLGAVGGRALPLLEVNDQVQVWERQTEEAYIHYVRSKETTNDLESGEYTMKLTTHWLGTADAWAVDAPQLAPSVPPPPTLPTPLAPADLEVASTPVSGGEHLELTWTADPLSEGFYVWEGGSDNAHLVDKVVEAGASSWTDQTLRFNGIFDYWLSLFNGAAVGPQSHVQINVNTVGPTPDPVVVGTGPGSGLQQFLGWSAEALSIGSGWQDGTNVLTHEANTGTTNARFVTCWSEHTLGAAQEMVNDFVTLSAPGQKLHGKIPIFSITLGLDDVGFNGASLPAVNAGAKNANIIAFAHTLLDSGLTDFILRMGWEYTIQGDFSYSYSLDQAGSLASQIAFRDAYTLQADLIKGICAAAKFEVCAFPVGYDYSASIPWAVADYVGLDLYDAWQGQGSEKTSNTDPYATYSDPVAAWHGLWYNAGDVLNPPAGSAAWLWNLTLDSAHPRLFAISEWGLMARVALPAAGGGDNPYFIDRSCDLTATGHIDHIVYFGAGANFGGANQDHIIWDGHFPKALSTFEVRMAA